MLWIGAKNYDKGDDLGDYLLGGRKLGSWMTAMSAQASDMSGWLLIGLPGMAYAIYNGTLEAIWTAIGLWIGTYLNWKFVAKRLRQYTKQSSDSLTLPVFFENRFRDKNHILRVVSAVFIIVFFLVYTAAQFAAGGKLFNTIFGIDYLWGMIIGAVIILAYTSLGGFNAVCITDTIMGLTMFFALIIVPVITTLKLGGFQGLEERLATLSQDTLGLIPKKAGTVDKMLIASSLGWGLGYFGQPHILARFMAIESPDMIKKSRVIAMGWVSITLAAAIIIGIVGKAFIPNLPDGETIYMELINRMFNPVVSGVLMTAILAAIMSTASSQLLVAASSVSTDIYVTLFKKDLNDPKIVTLSRATVIIISVIAMALAIKPDSSVFSLVAFAWGGFGAAFGPLIIFALFWRRMTLQGAICGMIVGGVSDFIWYFMDGGIWDVYEIIPGFILASIAIIVVSFITKQNEELAVEFDEVKNIKF